jgi:hypothetical protein
MNLLYAYNLQRTEKRILRKHPVSKPHILIINSKVPENDLLWCLLQSDSFKLEENSSYKNLSGLNPLWYVSLKIYPMLRRVPHDVKIYVYVLVQLRPSVHQYQFSPFLGIVAECH